MSSWSLKHPVTARRLKRAWRLGRLCAEVCAKVIFVGWSRKFRAISTGARQSGLPLPSRSYGGRDVLSAQELLRADLRDQNPLYPQSSG